MSQNLSGDHYNIYLPIPIYNLLCSDMTSHLDTHLSAGDSNDLFIILRNSSSFISPSPSRSNSSIISCNSSSVIRSPSSFATRFKFLKEIFPVLSSSKSLKAFRTSSLGSRSLNFCVIIERNSSKSIVPDPSLSTSAIIFLTSPFFGSKPNARIATFSSLESMYPFPSVSNKSKASLISCFCCSVNSALPFLGARTEPEMLEGGRVEVFNTIFPAYPFHTSASTRFSWFLQLRAK
mmetsp:Transcript_45823/g.74772  ORF Transcript_45823/g.74772 Transcript_45823/m.74772 type:complete len:235 (-) Transcript_45823:34-738(-)